ncbi:reverse transcriptase, partial [Phytophthora megakarya]
MSELMPDLTVNEAEYRGLLLCFALLSTQARGRVVFWGDSEPVGGELRRIGTSEAAILWKLPEWTILEAMSEHMPNLTVNEAEYRGLLLCFDLLSTQARGRVVFCGDSNLVIRQMRGEIDCKAPGLQLLRQKALNQLRSWPKHEFRDGNQSADKLASAALQREEGEIVTAEGERQDLITLNRLHEILQPKSTRSVTRVNAITRSAVNRSSPAAAMDESI